MKSALLMMTTATALLTVAMVHAQSAQDLEPRVQTSTALSASPIVTAPATAIPAPPAVPTAVQPAPPPSSPVSAPPASRPAATAGIEHGAAAVPAARTAANSADRLELGTTEISGNRELPKLMYIVPWHSPEVGPFAGRPPNSLVDEALTPIDRAVFERQNRYYAALQASAAAPAPPTAPPGAVGASAGPAVAHSGPASGRDEK